MFRKREFVCIFVFYKKDWEGHGDIFCSIPVDGRGMRGVMAVPGRTEIRKNT